MTKYVYLCPMNEKIPYSNDNNNHMYRRLEIKTMANAKFETTLRFLLQK